MLHAGFLNQINEMLQERDPLHLPEATSEPRGGKLLQWPWLLCRGVSFVAEKEGKCSVSSHIQYNLGVLICLI